MIFKIAYLDLETLLSFTSFSCKAHTSSPCLTNLIKVIEFLYGSGEMESEFARNLLSKKT